MRYLIFFLLACVLGMQFGNAINAAARDVSKAEKAACRTKAML